MHQAAKTRRRCHCAHLLSATLREPRRRSILLPDLEIEISASDIRGQVSAALDRLCAGHELLPDAVCEYIAAHGLYRGD